MRTVTATRYGRGSSGRRSSAGVAAVLGLVTAVAAGCDFSITNPGPVQDAFLDNPQAFPGIVNGMGRAYSAALGVDAFGDFAKIVGCVTREVFPSGNLINHGCDVNEEQGLLVETEETVPWNGGQNARFVAEDGIRRMERVLEAKADSNVNVARGYLWAGFANRLLGENMCEAVFDGGPREPRTEFLERAEAQFTKTIAIASTIGGQDALRLAATAGRASVRMHLGDWAGAVTDASAVPLGFKLQVAFENISVETYNFWVWSKASSPFRSVSVWNTPFLQYYTDYNDPRTPWVYDSRFPYGELARPCCGRVPFYAQAKYNKVEDPMDIADGREMALIRAEALLRGGSWPQAMSLINDTLRAPLGVAPWTATNLTEAWTRLKRERGIELWLEGRRLGDLRRWQAESTPGSLDPLEDPANPGTYLNANRSLCFPVPTSETDTNPNVR